MKVVKNNSRFPMRIKCRRVVDEYGFSYGSEKEFCGSELEIEEIDIRKHTWSKYPDFHGTDFGVICPVCGKFVVVDWEQIPKRVLDNATKIRI